MRLWATHKSRTNSTWLAVMTWLAVCLVAAGANVGWAEAIQKSSRDGEVVLSVSVSESIAQVAQPLTLRCEVTAPEGTQVSFPVVGAQLGAWDVLQHSDAWELPSPTGRLWVRTLTLETIQTGDVPIPAIEIVWRTRAGGVSASRTLASKPLDVRIASVLDGQADLTKFREIRSVVDAPIPAASPKRSWVRIASVVGGSTVSLAIVGLVFAWRRRRPRIQARRWALGEIDSLVELEPFPRGASGDVLLRLANIVREYMGYELGVSGSMQTTDELLDRFTRAGLMSAESLERLREVLVAADQAKFAGVLPSREHVMGWIAQTRAVIAATDNVGEGV